MPGGFDSSTQGQLRTPAATTDRERAQRALTRRAAVLTVATRAPDADDCALLLEALGLHPSEGLTP